MSPTARQPGSGLGTASDRRRAAAGQKKEGGAKRSGSVLDLLANAAAQTG